MEAQLDRARESHKQQIQQADAALEQFKKQVELSTEKTYSEMKHQVCRVNAQTHTCPTHMLCFLITVSLVDFCFS